MTAGMSAHIHVIDVETTGLDPEADRIVEIAAVTVALEPRPRVEALALDTLVNPGVSIGPVAQSIHHIGDDMVAGAPRYETLIPRLGELARSGPFAAHRAAFDRAFTGSRRPWICTWRLARHLWPEAPGHANQVLRYHLRLEVDARLAGEAGIVPHRAAGDALVSAALLVRELEQAPAGADLPAWALDLSAKPRRRGPRAHPALRARRRLCVTGPAPRRTGLIRQSALGGAGFTFCEATTSAAAGVAFLRPPRAAGAGTCSARRRRPRCTSSCPGRRR